MNFVEVVNDVVVALSHWNPVFAYLVIGFSAFLENVIPPVPGDVVVIFSAYLVGRGVLDWVPVYVVTSTGGTLGFWVMFILGSRHGRQIVQSRLWLVSEERLQKASGWLQRHGPWLILANRFLSGIRSVIALSAGIGGMSWKPVVILGLVSMVAWNGLLIYVGLVVGQNWDHAVQLLSGYNRLVLLVITAVVAAMVVRAYWHRRATRGRVDSS